MTTVPHQRNLPDGTETRPVRLRLPRTVHSELRERAHAAGESLNLHVARILAEAVGIAVEEDFGT